MDVLAGKTLMRKDGELVSADEALSNVEVIGFYFSAHWCPPCRFFTPVLAEFHAALKEANEPFEVVFISSDETKEEMMTYMTESHGDWLAVPFGEDILSQGDGSPTTNEAIKEKYSIIGIPTLIITKKDGEQITNNGRDDVQMHADTAWESWQEGKGVAPPDVYGEGKEEEEKEKEDEEGAEDKEDTEEKEADVEETEEKEAAEGEGEAEEEKEAKEEEAADAEEAEEKEEEEKEDAEEKEAETTETAEE